MSRTPTEKPTSQPDHGLSRLGRWPTLLAVLAVASGGVVFAAGVISGVPVRSRVPDPPAPSRSAPDDSCHGVRVTPAMALQATLDASPEDTTFCLASGVYHLVQPIIPKKGSVIWGTAGTVLNGSHPAAAARRAGPHWVMTAGINELGKTACQPQSSDSCELWPAVIYDDRLLGRVASREELAPGRFFFESAADTIYLADDPTGHAVGVAVTPGAIGTGEGDARQDDVTLRKLVVERFAGGPPGGRAAAISTGWNWRIEDSEIRFNGAAGVALDTGGVLRNNRVHHNGYFGLVGGPLRGLTVEDCDISFNNIFGIEGGGGGGRVVRSSDLVFRRNLVRDNVGGGLRTDNANVNVTYEANTLERNAGPGISHDGSGEAVIRNNAFRQNGAGLGEASLFRMADLHLTNSENVEIVGNTIDAGVHGIGLLDIAWDADSGVQAVRNVYVHDNSVRMRDGGFTGLVGSRRPAYTTANNRFERNRYYVTDVSVIFFMWQGSCSWSEWQAKGHDVTGVIEIWTPGLSQPDLQPPGPPLGKS